MCRLKNTPLFQFLIDHNLKSNIAKVRKEAVRDLGLLYKSRATYEVVNALKETVSKETVKKQEYETLGPGSDDCLRIIPHNHTKSLLHSHDLHQISPLPGLH